MLSDGEERTSENGGNESCSESERQIFEMSRAANTKTIRAGGRTSEWKREKFNFMG